MKTKLDRVKMLAENLMTYHGLSLWRFQFDGSVRRFGYCHPRKQLISLSAKLTMLNTETEILNVILHEIAHALVPNVWHTKEWCTMAKSIGCTGERCYDATVITPPKPYKGTCPKCGKIIQVHRRRKTSCGKCDTKYNLAYLFKWTKQEVQ